MVQPDRPQMTASSILIACAIHRATNKYAEYLILLLRSNNVCTNAPKFNVICALPVLLNHGKYFLYGVDPFYNKNICHLFPAVVC